MKPCTRLHLIRTNIIENPILDDSVLKEFKIDLGESRFAIVKYEIKDNKTYDLIDSSIPEEYQGLGLGHVLAERVFTYLEDKRKNVILTCHFLRKCYTENSEKYKLCVLESNVE